MAHAITEQYVPERGKPPPCRPCRATTRSGIDRRAKMPTKEVGSSSSTSPSIAQKLTASSYLALQTVQLSC